MKRRTVILILILSLLWASLPCAAMEDATPFARYQAHTPVISREAVELHIGVIQPGLAVNPALEMAFLHKYPNGKILYYSFDQERLSALLLSGAPKLDLLILGAGTRAHYVRQGLIADLYTTSLLSAWPDTLIDFQEQAESGRGELFGFPKAIHQNVFGWNEPLAKSVQAERPRDVWSWDDFEALCSALRYDANGDGVNEYYLMQGHAHENGMSGFVNEFLEQYAYQYALKGGSFQTEEFKHLMRLFQKIHASGALMRKESPAVLFEGESAALIELYSYQASFYGDGTRTTFFPLPTLDMEKPAYVGQLYSFSLLNNAPHREPAIEFLRSALDADIQNMVSADSEMITKRMPEYYAFNPNVSIYEAFAPNEQGELTHVVDSLKDYIVSPIFHEDPDMPAAKNPETYPRFAFMKEHVLVNTAEWYDLSRLLFQLLPGYMDGSRSFDEVAAALDMQMAMMQNE